MDLGSLDEYGMSGLFSKLVHAVAKPFQQIFPAKTGFGKILDPLGLTDPKRNLNLAGRVADVLGTAATLAAGAYAVGAATGATGGFWATASAGAKTAAMKLGSGLMSAGKGAVSVAGAAAKALGPTAAAMLVGGGGAIYPAATAQEGVQTAVDASGAYGGGGSMDWGSGGGLGPLGGSASGGGGGAGDMPGAVVPVTDTMPSDGPNWLLIGGFALAALVIYKQFNEKR